MDLSVIIPSYNAEAYIARSVLSLVSFLEMQGLAFEIIVVDDGSSDKTSGAVEELKLSQVRLITLPKNRGKYRAIITGMSAARGRSRIFTDADIPFDLEALPYIYSLIVDRDFHLVIGDRALRDSHYTFERNFLRRTATFIFSALVRMFVTGGLFDTQCGLKGFRGDVADTLFPLLRNEGFSGDVELLYVALKYNLEIKRIPVRLRNAAPSSVRLLTHGLGMLGNISLLKIRWILGKYDSPALKAIAQQAYWQGAYWPPDQSDKTAEESLNNRLSNE